jgi:hypothetical protein
MTVEIYSPPRKEETTSGMYPVLADQAAGFEASFVFAETVEDYLNQFYGQLSEAAM